MLRKSGLTQLMKFKHFIKKGGGDISSKLKDKSTTNTLDKHIETSDDQKGANTKTDKQLKNLSKKSIINKVNEDAENKKFKVGDYVYPYKENWIIGKTHCWSSLVHLLKPIKYKVLSTLKRYDADFIEVDQIDTSKHENVFPAEWFMSELEYKSNKFNL